MSSSPQSSGMHGPVIPAPSIDAGAVNRGFETASPTDIVAWAARTFGSQLIMSSSFGAESAVLLHMAAKASPGIRVVLVDTGYLFPQTHAFMEELRQRLNLNVWTYRTRNDPIAYLTINGETDPAVRQDVDRCCAANKNEPFNRAMAELAPQGWLRGIRRSQTHNRKDRPFVEWAARYNCWAISPLLNMTTQQAYAYLKANGLPLHPLVDQGYVSIGCNPLTCTRPITASDDPRAGRWAGSSKTECGLHLT